MLASSQHAFSNASKLCLVEGLCDIASACRPKLNSSIPQVSAGASYGAPTEMAFMPSAHRGCRYPQRAFAPTNGKWVSTSGLFFDLSGVIQLAIAGVFERIMDQYEHTGVGPPSYISRHIIDNPNRPRAMWLRSTLFYNARTGLWLIVIGFSLELAGVWVPTQQL